MKLSRQLLGGLTVLLFGTAVSVYTSVADDDSLVEVGPSNGADVEEYMVSRQGALAHASGVHPAAVSFSDYLTEDVAKAVVPVRVRSWFVAAPGGEPEETDDPATWRLERTEAARHAVAEFEAVIPSTDDPEFVRQYEQDRDRERRVADALEAGTPFIFGAAVEGESGLLRGLAEDPLVRLVDVFEGSTNDDVHLRLRPLRPEETQVAGEPSRRP